MPEAKPALEWVNNRVLQKVSPKRRHAVAQSEFVSALTAWTHERKNGVAATEWHFQVRPPGEIGRTLVPDIAFLSYARMPLEQLKDTDIPRVSPDAVVEVRSPEDAQADIDEKTRVYLGAGTAVVFLVDPQRKTITIRDAAGSRILREDETLQHAALPGFSLVVRTLFTLPGEDRPK
ncbi:MAG: Uma2 family endonuclease [Candidatus Eremiobacteraeota bacterium]|nr:Uma2 family endonuclease [Candidatus Eremiobacteraeota bacterium]